MEDVNAIYCCMRCLPWTVQSVIIIRCRQLNNKWMGLIVFQDGYICKSESDLENKWGRKLTTTITSASISHINIKMNNKKGKVSTNHILLFLCFVKSTQVQMRLKTCWFLWIMNLMVVFDKGQTKIHLHFPFFRSLFMRCPPTPTSPFFVSTWRLSKSPTALKYL